VANIRLPVILKPTLSKCGTFSVPGKESAICTNDSPVITIQEVLILKGTDHRFLYLLGERTPNINI
jgi:hypothetical protein